jgi:integrase
MAEVLNRTKDVGYKGGMPAQSRGQSFYLDRKEWSHVNIVKKIKIDGNWKLLAIPRNTKGNYDWNALPEGLYLIEWRAGGRRRRASAGVTAAQSLEAQRQKRHELEGRRLGIPGFETAGEEPKKPALHVAVRKYLSEVETLRKPNTYRKYECALERFIEFFKDHQTIDQISSDDLTSYIIALKKDHSLGANTILHNAVIVAQFLKRLGRQGVTKGLQLPERITPLPREYREADLAKFFKAAYDAEKALYSTFLLTGFREMEVVHLYWSDINFDLRTARVTSKSELGFYPKRWEEREVPIPVKLTELLKTHRPVLAANSCFHHRQETASTTCSASTTCLTIVRRSPSVPVWTKRDSTSRHFVRPTLRGPFGPGSTFGRSSTGWGTNPLRRR